MNKQINESIPLKTSHDVKYLLSDDGGLFVLVLVQILQFVHNFW